MRRALPVLVCLLATVGCGGGGGDRLSRAEFVSQADAICAETQRELDALPEPQSLEEVANVVGEGETAVRDAIEELRALEPPEDLEDEVDAWLDALKEQLAEFGSLEEAARDGDQAEVERIVGRVDELENRGNERARAIGLDECARET